jgi:hypothetical protein
MKRVEEILILFVISLGPSFDLEIDILGDLQLCFQLSNLVPQLLLIVRTFEKLFIESIFCFSCLFFKLV